MRNQRKSIKNNIKSCFRRKHNALTHPRTIYPTTENAAKTRDTNLTPPANENPQNKMKSQPQRNPNERRSNLNITCTIICGPQAIPATRLAIKIYNDHKPSIPITVLMPAQIRHQADWQTSATRLIAIDEEIIDRDRIISFLSHQHHLGALRGKSVNWYLQQYLKLAHSWNSTHPVFINDGDTIFSPKLLDEMFNSPFLLTTNESTAIYNNTAAACNLPTNERSFVANGGLFVPTALRRLSNNPADWFIETMQRGVIKQNGNADFSEYQIMGSLIKNEYAQRRIKLFRRFDLITNPSNAAATTKKANEALKYYDAIAFEPAHNSSPKHRLLAKIAYAIGYSW